ncbi:ANTAR domain-containing response regulator [Desulfoscipio gibsoniae]
MGEFRVILIDADSVWRKNVKAMLTKSGHWVVGEAGDGLSAIKLVRGRQPDLLIIDTSLPGGMDGLQVAKIMHEDKLAPVIATSATGRHGILERAKEARVSALFIKPVEETILLPAVELAMANYQEISALEKKIKELQETLETRKAVERAKGILMETQGLTEAEAFKRMQRQSMNKRVSIRLVAEAVIMAHTLNK